jgi:GT2 family glycosyltransferase
MTTFGNSEIQSPAPGLPTPRRSPEPVDDPSVSVVICAYTEDRWAMLEAACTSVITQMAPDDELIVVIDHNDTLLRRVRERFAETKVIPNARSKGLSGARNTGVNASVSSVVAFLDDDAVAMPAWLQVVRESFREDRVCVVGTRVEPDWQSGKAPRWFPSEFGWVVGCSYRGQPQQRARVRNPIGASMAIRRDTFAAVGQFTEHLGRVGALPVGCEETEFCIRLADASPEAVIVLDPAAHVVHHVPRSRQRFQYFVRRCFHEGKSKRAVARISGRRAALAEERRYVRVVLPQAVLRAFRPTALVTDRAELLRAGSVVIGLTAAVTGYLSAAAGPGIRHRTSRANGRTRVVAPENGVQ